MFTFQFFSLALLHFLYGFISQQNSFAVVIVTGAHSLCHLETILIIPLPALSSDRLSSSCPVTNSCYYNSQPISLNHTMCKVGREHWGLSGSISLQTLNTCLMFLQDFFFPFFLSKIHQIRSEFTKILHNSSFVFWVFCSFYFAKTGQFWGKTNSKFWSLRGNNFSKVQGRNVWLKLYFSNSSQELGCKTQQRSHHIWAHQSKSNRYK